MEDKKVEVKILSEGWTMSIPEKNVYCIGPEPIPMKMPGSVYSALLDNSLMPDPFYRENELDACKLMENDFIFTEHFGCGSELMETEKKILRFDGIDTLSEVTLNGHVLGKTENMHRRYEFDVTGILKAEDNVLLVKIFSPNRFIREAYEKVKTCGSQECMDGFPQLRKCHCMFGWDWGPRLPDAGIFRPVSVLGINKARFSDDIRITQKHIVDSVGIHGNNTSEVDITVSAVTEPADVSGAHTDITLTDPDGRVSSFDKNGQIKVIKPRLWWPNGYGRQDLYTVTLKLVDDVTGEELDKTVKRIGLRTVTVDTAALPDEKRDPHIGPQIEEDKKEGRKFDFTVNGLPIFVMGSDYIPEDNVLSRVTPKRTRKLLTDAVEAHNNALRVWGGGYYLDDYFYDIADELGLLIWQDFMFACASYELTDEFEDNLTAEFTGIVRRLRHHACIGLWCGNNEMETQYLMGSWQASKKQFYDYIRLYEYIIPKILKREDPVTFYWPSSPSSGGNFDDPFAENIGDAHYWGVWHGGDPFTAYRRHHFRFMSEFGFQSFPCMKTIESFTEPEDRNIFSEIMEMHQRNTAANGKIMTYLSATYRYPKNFDELIYASQMLQLDAIRYGVEYFRRIRGTCMGTVIWQINDIWPVASWASIDYYGRWKALQYGEKRFFAPVSISCEEHGRIDQMPFVNLQPVEVEYSGTLHVANETGETVSGTVKWQLMRADSSVIRQGEKEITVMPFAGTWIEKEVFNGAEDERTMHLHYEFVAGGEVISSGSSLFVAPKHYHFIDPQLKVKTDGDEITVTAEAFAKGVCIESDDGNLRLSDNFFDMEKGQRTVKIIGTKPSGVYHARSVYDIADTSYDK
jgi:beta-mannosidase